MDGEQKLPHLAHFFVNERDTISCLFCFKKFEASQNFLDRGIGEPRPLAERGRRSNKSESRGTSSGSECPAGRFRDSGIHRRLGRSGAPPTNEYARQKFFRTINTASKISISDLLPELTGCGSCFCIDLFFLRKGRYIN